MQSLVFICFLVSAVSSSALHASVDSVCRELSTLLPNKVLLPNTTFYTSSTQSYFFRESRLNPNCVVVPSSAKDVSQAVKVLTAHPSVKFAIKGGGHSVNKGASNIDDGITIDLSGMRAIEPQGGSWDTVEVGPGATSVDAYRVLDVHNRTVVGGRVASVGLAGFMTGGGLSFFSPERGFGCDTIVNLEVVLASGAIVNANSTSHPELFQALKGGQNNFGIVTRFDLKTFPQGQFWGGAIQYPDAANDAQFEAFTKFKGPNNYDPHVEIEQTFIYYGSFGSFFSSNNMFYTKPIVNASGLDYFTKIQPQTSSTMRISNTTDFATEIEMLQPAEQYAIYSTSTFAITPTILKKLHALWKTTTDDLVSITNITSVLTYQSLPPPPPASNPNSMPFPPKSSPHTTQVLGLVSIYWPLESDSAKITDAVKKLQGLIEATTKEEGVYTDYKYINYATSLFQQPIRGYGAQRVKELKRVAKKYDPRNTFQKQAPGGFKLDD